MSEKLYAILIRLYPEHFRRTYGEEALRLVRDRARDEKGLLAAARLWLDLLVDLAVSLPREYSIAPTTPIPAAQGVSGEPSFQLLDERSPNAALLFVAGMFSALLFLACVTAVAHSPIFPTLFRDSHSLQWLVQSNLALARSPVAAPVGEYSFCMIAVRDIPSDSAQPLFTFNFAPPGASGVALIDGKTVQTFGNDEHLSIRADVFAGDHPFALRLDRPAENTSLSTNDDFKYCSPK